MTLAYLKNKLNLDGDKQRRDNKFDMIIWLAEVVEEWTITKGGLLDNETSLKSK